MAVGLPWRRSRGSSSPTWWRRANPSHHRPDRDRAVAPRIERRLLGGPRHTEPSLERNAAFLDYDRPFVDFCCDEPTEIVGRHAIGRDQAGADLFQALL